MKLTKILALWTMLGAALGASAATDLTAWQASLPDGAFVRDVSIPGAHDAATSGINNGISGHNQDLDLAGLFDAGVRAFDLRPKYTGNQLMIYHGIASTNVTMDNALETISNKLAENPTEFAVIVIRDEDSNDGNAWANAMSELINKYDDKIVRFAPALSVSDVRGKMILLSRNGFTSSKVGFINGWGDNNTFDCSLGSGRIKVQDYYEFKNKSDKTTAFRNMLNEAAGSPEFWIINHTSGYIPGLLGGTDSAVRTNASNTNSYAVTEIAKATGRVGIIVMDYAGVAKSKSGNTAVYGDELVSAVIDANKNIKPASPYVGVSPEEAFAKGGKYFLYQVESGTWIQTNRKPRGVGNDHTTHAELGGIGLDVELRRPNDSFTKGYQLFYNFTNNGELNGSDEDRFFFDQGDRQLTEWVFEPYGIGYRIKVEARDPNARDRDKVAKDTYIGFSESANFGGISDNPEYERWQIVSLEERIEKMKAEAAENGYADATFLLPWNEKSRNNLRDRDWVVEGGRAHGGRQFAPVVERWNCGAYNEQYTLTGLPNGKYSFAVQGYYRDGSVDNLGTRQRYVDGKSETLATYFAGKNSNYFMSIFDEGRVLDQDGFKYLANLVGDNDVPYNSCWIPNSMDNAGEAFVQANDIDVMSLATPYMNYWVPAAVTDGTLTVGVHKNDKKHDGDWLVYQRMFLRYEGDNPNEPDDLTDFKARLKDLIDEIKGYDYIPGYFSLEEAENTLATATKNYELWTAFRKLDHLVDPIRDYNATKKFTDKIGQEESESIHNTFMNAGSRKDCCEALRELRYVRRRAAADHQADVFEGNAPQNGEFYIYNVGQQQFLCGGADWGAHAALGFPGTLITLEDGAENPDTHLIRYFLNTKLNNGGNNQYLNHHGYMDAGRGEGYAFIPVEGKDGVYNIVRGNNANICLAWDPNAFTDGHNNDETTVGTEKEYDKSDPNAQWKLVTKEERLALMENASLENPVDVSFLIGRPNFNHRVNPAERDRWDMNGFAVWAQGANHHDFICESYNCDQASLSCNVYDLPEGVYQVTVQGFSRGGSSEYQVNNEPVQHSELFAGEETALLPNVMDESFNAPGEGVTLISDDNETTIHIPHTGDQAAVFFRTGLYKTSVVVEVKNASRAVEPLNIGVRKTSRVTNADWTVVDNFRVKYYGNKATKEEVEQTTDLEDAVVAAPETDTRIFNLQGIEVKNPTAPGIYIRGGRKFIVR